MELSIPMAVALRREMERIADEETMRLITATAYPHLTEKGQQNTLNKLQPKDDQQTDKQAAADRDWEKLKAHVKSMSN